MTEQELVDRLVHAWATRCGFFQRARIKPVAQRLNNPCCLTHWKDQTGQPYQNVCGAVEFPDVDTGWRAARGQTRINLKRGLTFYQFFAGKPGVYRGAVARELDPVSYARAVADALCPGMDINVPILDLLGVAT